MRILIVLLCLLITGITNAREYYVDGTYDGSGGTDGSITRPFQTLTQLNDWTGNGTGYEPGDVIYLHRGQTFYGFIKTTIDNIIITSYGNKGGKPVISGFKDVRHPDLGTEEVWKNDGLPQELVERKVYRISLNSLTIPDNLLLVTLNGAPQQLARYPNGYQNNGQYINPETGFLTYTDLVYNNPSNLAAGGQLYDDHLPYTEPNLTMEQLVGSELCVRTTNYTLDRYLISGYGVGTNSVPYLEYQLMNNLIANRGSQLYIQPRENPNPSGDGYYFQNNLNFVDTYGEWFYDKTEKYRTCVLSRITPMPPALMKRK